MATPVHTRVTAEEYYKLPESTEPIELIDGEIIVSPVPQTTHQFVVAAVYELVKALSEGGKVLFSPVEVYFDQENIPQPDLLWVSQERISIITKKHVVGAPDLIVEVLSPSTAKLDKTKKFRLYQQYGVREYWIADPEAGYLEAWSLVEGAYRYIGAFAAGEGFDSVVLAKRVDVSAIFPEADGQ